MLQIFTTMLFSGAALLSLTTIAGILMLERDAIRCALLGSRAVRPLPALPSHVRVLSRRRGPAMAGGFTTMRWRQAA